MISPNPSHVETPTPSHFPSSSRLRLPHPPPLHFPVSPLSSRRRSRCPSRTIPSRSRVVVHFILPAPPPSRFPFPSLCLFAMMNQTLVLGFLSISFSLTFPLCDDEPNPRMTLQKTLSRHLILGFLSISFSRRLLPLHFILPASPPCPFPFPSPSLFAMMNQTLGWVSCSTGVAASAAATRTPAAHIVPPPVLHRHLLHLIVVVQKIVPSFSVFLVDLTACSSVGNRHSNIAAGYGDDDVQGTIEWCGSYLSGVHI